MAGPLKKNFFVLSLFADPYIFFYNGLYILEFMLIKKIVTKKILSVAIGAYICWFGWYTNHVCW